MKHLYASLLSACLVAGRDRLKALCEAANAKGACPSSVISFVNYL